MGCCNIPIISNIKCGGVSYSDEEMLRHAFAMIRFSRGVDSEVGFNRYSRLHNRLLNKLVAEGHRSKHVKA